jgi:hypothetical protein
MCDRANKRRSSQSQGVNITRGANIAGIVLLLGSVAVQYVTKGRPDDDTCISIVPFHE